MSEGNNNKNTNQSLDGLTQETLKGLFWMFSGTGIQFILRLLVLIVLARLLTPQDFGLVGAAMVIVSFSEIFSQLGVGPAIVQRSQLKKTHLCVAFFISIISGLILAGLVFILAPYIASFFRMEKLVLILKIFSMVFVIKGFSAVSEALLQRELKFKWLATVQVISYALGFGVVGVTMGFMEYGVWALVAAYLTQEFVKSSTILISKPHSKRPMFDVIALKELMYFGSGFTIARISNQLALQGDNLVVGRWLGESALGVYSRAYQMMTMPATLFGQVLDKVLFPVMAKVQDDLGRLTSVYKRGVALIALITAPISAIMFILAPEITLLLLGPQWDEAVLPFQILATAIWFRTSYKISDSIARATGAVYRRAWRQVIYAFCIIGGSWIGSYWGIAGVAFGVLCALFVNFILMAQLSISLTLLTWKSFFRVHFSAAFLTIVVSIIVYTVVAMSRVLLLPDIGVVLLAILIFITSIITVFFISPVLLLGEEGLWIFRTLLSYVPAKIGSKVNRWVNL